MLSSPNDVPFSLPHVWPVPDSDDDPEYIRILLHDPDTNLVLMTVDNDLWDFPYFFYPDGIAADYRKCCKEFQAALGLPAKPNYFTVLADVLGARPCMKGKAYHSEEEFGFAQLLWLEPQLPFDVESNQFAWKDLAFLEAMDHGDSLMDILDSCLKAVVKLLKRDEDLLERLEQPRFQLGWYKKASEWLSQIIKRDDHSVTSEVLQEQITPSSTVLKVNSSDGWYFLKAPTKGCTEMQFAEIVSKLLPDYTPDLVSFSQELHAFVSREFIEMDQGEELDDINSASLQTLARFQQASIPLLESLKDCGCPVRGPEEMIDEVRRWAKEPRFITIKRFRKFDEMLPDLEALISELQSFKVPLTVVHGDFGSQNIAYRRGGAKNTKIIFHDWEFSCLSHPFCDLHEAGQFMNESKLNTYLDMWKSFEAPDRLRRALKIGKTLGWLLKMWSTMDCIRAGQLDDFDCEDFFFQCYDFLEDDIAHDLETPNSGKGDEAPSTSSCEAEVAVAVHREGTGN